MSDMSLYSPVDVRDKTILELFDAAIFAALSSGERDGGEAEVALARAEIKRRLAQIHAEGSIGGRIQSLIGPDAVEPSK